MKRLAIGTVLLCSVLLLWTTSYADVPLSVPFKSQVPPGQWKNTLNCGQTSALMIFSYYNNTTPTEENITEIDDWLFERFGDSTNNYNGSVTNTSKLLTLAVEFGNFIDSSSHANWTLEDLRNELENGFPVIVAVRTNMNTSGVGHFMVLIGIDDSFVYVNDPGKTLGANNRYSISQFESVWATQRYSVTTIHPNATQANVVRTNATLNGQPFSGSVNYNIVGPNGVIIGLAVPGETSNLAAGQYTFIYQNGGPTNSVLTSITPSSSQILVAGSSVTFTLNFSAANGLIIGSVKDAITRQPLPNAIVAAYRDNDLIASLLTNADGLFETPADSGSIYRFEISRSGYLPVTYNNVSVLPNETKALDVILQIDDSHAGSGNVSGTVFDAISAVGVPGLTINLRRGINTTNGTIVRTTSTAADGTYSFTNLPAGNYTVQASGGGFTDSYFSIISVGGTTIDNQNGVISAILPTNQVRIVLTWGETPPDLDSHFWGPLSDGTRFHIYYPFAEENDGSPWPTVVRLDLDDTTSFGPETTTLLDQIDGVYTFAVHDYTNRDSTTSAALSQSQAHVKVYRGSNVIASFNVPFGQPGTLWTVFELEGNTILPVNQMSFSNEPFATSNNVQIGPDLPLKKLNSNSTVASWRRSSILQAGVLKF